MTPEFRPMRRIRQQLTTQESEHILKNATAGVLGVYGDKGYPYTVPVSYVYNNGKIYLHSALKGHKVDAIRRNPKVSFCVIAEDNIKPQEFTTYFRSVIAFGQARILEDDEKLAGLQLLATRYSAPGITPAMTEKEITKGFNHLLMIEIAITHLTGKQAIELLNSKKKR